MLESNKFKITFLAILACLLWSTAFAGIKIGLKYSSPIFFAGMRFLLAGIFLLPFCGGTRNYFNSIRNNIKTIIKLSFFQTFLLYALLFWGMTLVPGSIGAIVTGTTPLMSAITAHVLLKDDKLYPKKAIYIFSGIFGIILISVERQLIVSTSLKELAGIFILLGSTLASATGNVIVSADKSEVAPVTLNSVQIGLGGIMLLLLSFIIEGSPSFILAQEFIVSLLWLSFISAAGFSIWFYLLKVESVKVSELNMWKFIIPVFGALISWLALEKDSPTVLSVLGMLIVAASVLFFNLQKGISSQ